MVGVYGVTSYNVRRQRREYGIRLALGADPGAVRRLIVRRGAAVAAIGIAIGAVGGLLLTRLLASMLNDVKPTDPAVFLGERRDGAARVDGGLLHPGALGRPRRSRPRCSAQRLGGRRPIGHRSSI